MRTRLTLAIATLGAAAIAAAAQDPGPAPVPVPSPPEVGAATRPSRLNDLLYMAGTWRGELLGGTFEEHWMRPRGGLILGCGRLLKNGKAVFHEYLRIEERDGEVLYTVQPMGRKGVTYRLTESSFSGDARSAVFTNPEHQRQHTIEYHQDGTGLRGRIAGVRDGKPWEQTFKFRPAPDGRLKPKATLASDEKR